MASFPQGKSFKEMEEAFDATPLFMSSLPQDAQENPALAALQSLIYDDPPLEVALNFKKQGNEWYNQRPATATTRKEAITFYTKGIKVAGIEKEPEVLAALHCNRAAVHLEIQNYASALCDCRDALLRNPKLVKAWYRSAKASLLIEKLDDARDCIQRGLQIEENNDSLKDLISVCDELQVKLEARERQRMQRVVKEAQIEKTLIETLALRQAKLKDAKGASTLNPPIFKHPLGGEKRVHLSTDNLLLWPVMLLYPEYQESDFIAEFNECNSLRDHLDMIFETKAPWDIKHEYRIENLVAYFISDSKILCKVGFDLSLSEIIAHDSFLILDGVVSLYILVGNSKFEIMFRQQFTRE